MMNIAESSYKLKENPAKCPKMRENASGQVAVSLISVLLKGHYKFSQGAIKQKHYYLSLQSRVIFGG